MKERLPVGSLVVTAIVSFVMGAFLGLFSFGSEKMRTPQLPFYKSQYPTPLYFGNIYLEVPPGWEVRNQGANSVEIVSRHGSVLTLDFLANDEVALARKRLTDEKMRLIMERNRSGNTIFTHTVDKGHRWIFEGFIYARSNVTSFKATITAGRFDDLSRIQQLVLDSRETV